MHKVAIVGGGIAGLTAAFQLKSSNADLQLNVLESADRLGGFIGTLHDDGYLVELGPNGFLDSRTHIVELGEKLGLSDTLERAKQESEQRFILIGGRLRRLPKSPKEFLFSDVLSFRGKLRFLRERLTGRASKSEDESIADFARRRFGKEATNALVDAVATGIYAGDIEKLSARSCFPTLVELEAKCGSLLKAQAAIAKERRKAGFIGSSLGTLACPVGGMGRLIERLHEKLGDGVELNAAVDRIERTAAGLRIEVGGKERLFDAVVLATPASVAARLTGVMNSSLSAELAGIETAPAAVVALSFRRSDLPAPPVGFGYLAPERLGRPVLGVVYSSNVFAHQAPAREFMFRALLGGARRRDVVEWDDDKLVEAVRNDLQSLLGIDAAPKFEFVQRWRNAIPQYHVGHAARLERIEEHLKATPGLFLAGASFRGVSVADCVKDGMAVAEVVRRYLDCRSPGEPGA